MYTFRNWVFTQVALGELIATVVVALISLFLGISVYYDIRFYFAYHSALASYAGGHLELAGPQIDSALRFRNDFPAARELAAKIKIDGVTNGIRSSEALADAEKLLQMNTGKAARAGAATYLGLAVIHLKRADIAKAGKTPVDPELKEAEDALNAAEAADGENIDAKILRAQLLLRRGSKEDLATADTLLGEAYQRMKGSASVKDLPTIDVLVDFYFGQMAIFAAKDDWAAARQSAQRVLLLRPTWDLTNSNLAVLEARRFVTDRTIKLEELQRRTQEVEALVAKLQAIYARDPEGNKYAQDAAYGLRLSFGLAYSNIGDYVSLNSNVYQALAIDDRRPSANLNFIASLDQLLKRPNVPSSERDAMTSLKPAATAGLYKLDLSPARRVVVDNNLGVYTFPTDRNQALEYFNQALKVAADNKLKCAVVKRNLAVCHYPDDSTKILQYVEESLADDPDQPDLVEFKKKLH